MASKLIEGSHYILVKDGFDVHLSIPVHKGRDMGVGLLRKLIRKAGLTPEEYIAFFRGKKLKGR